MKLEFIQAYDYKRPKGYSVEIETIKASDVAYGGYLVKVINEWKNPKWLSLAWFLPVFDKFGNSEMK